MRCVCKALRQDDESFFDSCALWHSCIGAAVVTTLVYLIPVALFLGTLGLSGVVWALRSGQYEDLDGAAERILVDQDDDLER